MENREKSIIQTSIIGIVVNLFLSIIKIIVGILSNSIAIVSDAINNMSDALSSAITIFGMKLALKPANKKHPYGYGRIEYLTASLVSFLVLFAGVEFFISSVKRVITPVKTSYSWISVAIIVIAILAKLFLGKYTKGVGEKVNSTSLQASGTDSVFDALISSVTLLSVIFTKISGIVIDGYVGVIVSILVIYAGTKLMKETIDNILGSRADDSLVKQIKKDVLAEELIIGVYDLILNNYGPTKMIGSINVELPEYLSVKEAYYALRKVQRNILNKYGIFLVIGIYAVNTSDEEIMKMEKDIRGIVTSFSHVLQVHAFVADIENHRISFDMVVDFEVLDDLGFKNEIMEKLLQTYENYQFAIQVDKDYTE